MSFQDAIRVCLTRKYATFSGRARRSEFWYFVLFNVIVSIVASLLDNLFGTRYSSTSGGVTVYSSGIISSLASLALLLPGLAVSARRLHDTGRSGWWILIGLIPLVGIILLIVWYAQESHADNKYGPNPKGLTAGYPGGGYPVGGQGYGQQQYPPQGYGQQQYPPQGYGQPQYPGQAPGGQQQPPAGPQY